MRVVTSFHMWRRINVAAYMVWIAVLAITLLRSRAPAGPRDGRELLQRQPGSLKRETQIDSIRSQSAYAAAIGTRQARTGSRPGRLSRMPECCDLPGGRCVYEFA